MTKQVTSMADEIVSRLEATTFGAVICIEDCSIDVIHHEYEALRRSAEEAGRDSFLVSGVDTANGRGSLYGVLSTWVESHCDEIDDSRAVLRLFDYLTMTMDIGSEAVKTADRVELMIDAVIQLVERLIAYRPAILTVTAPHRVAQTEHKVLVALMEHFLADPLAEVDPAAASAPALSFVWGGPWEGLAGVETERVKFGEQGISEIRRFLNEDRIVEQIFDTTDGDPRRLKALFDGLPQSITHLWARRVAELNPAQRRVAEYLAVADRALELSFLERLVDETSVVSAAQALCDGGIATRGMRDGAVRVELADDEIRRAISEGLDADIRRDLHLILANAAIETRDEDGAFIASHALAGGDAELGVRYGLSAVRQLLRRGRLEEADELSTQLRGMADLDPDTRRQILQLSLRIVEARGAWREALPLARQLEGLADSSPSGRLERRIGTYLMKIGNRESAQERFSSALERIEGRDAEAINERVRALLGIAEIHYRAGEHEDSERRALAAIEELAGHENDDDGDAGELILECRNILGKVALFCGDLKRARRYFERNATDAQRANRIGDEACAEVNLGVVALQQQRYQDAAQRLTRALENCEVPGGPPRLYCWMNLGIVHQRRGHFTEALEDYRRSLREATRCGNDVARAVSAHNLATLYQDMGAFDKACHLVERLHSAGQNAAKKGGSPFTARWAAVVEVQVLFAQERWSEGLEAWKEAEANVPKSSRWYETEMAIRCATAYLKLGQLERARTVLEETSEAASSTPLCSAIHDFNQQWLHFKDDESFNESTWRQLIDQLETLGLYRHAVSARLIMVSHLDGGDEAAQQTARRLVARGVEELRQRADRLPDRFRSDYFAIADHRELLEQYQRFGGERLPDELRMSKESVATSTEQPEEADAPRDERDYQLWRSRYPKMIGEDASILQVFRFVDRVASGETTILVSGESGTGKELVAEAVHRHSNRSDEPFVKVNCAAFVEDLLLSELFGHKKGAFTGAVSDRKGRFERADGGTIFLDEIGDISPKTQVALLRVLQEGTFEPVGSAETHCADVRVVAATNRDLDEMVREGTFRLDLYYRLKGFLIEMPPLRQRRQDIPRLLKHFVERFSDDGQGPEFSNDAIQFLAQYKWPGNIRELENFVRSALLFAEDASIGMKQVVQFREFFSECDLDEQLPPIDPDVDIGVSMDFNETTVIAGDTEEALVEEMVADGRSLSKLKKRLERKCIKRALRQTDGNISQAARILQMKRPRLSQIVNGTAELLALKEELVG